MSGEKIQVDVLCVGYACYDLVFSVGRHFGPDEKGFATSYKSCGGGPAANAAITAKRLGYKTALAGYLGNDVYGEAHYQELQNDGIITHWLLQGAVPTPLSVILVKPDGQRTVVNYQTDIQMLREDNFDFQVCQPGVILFDGFQPEISILLVQWARQRGIPTVLDGGSSHPGTKILFDKVDYLVASERFARQLTSESDEKKAIKKLSEIVPAVVVTLSARGLVWRKDGEEGCVPAFKVDCVDSTGAGDAFHGAFAAGLIAQMPWGRLLEYASAVGALCCTKMGGRLGIPTSDEVDKFLRDCR